MSQSTASSPPQVQLVMCDMAGTTVDDTYNGLPLITYVLQQTFSQSPYQIVLTPEEITPLRGRKKQEMVQELVKRRWKEIEECVIEKKKNGGSALTSSTVTTASVTAELFSSFESHLDAAISSLHTEMPGTSATFTFLHEKGVKIGVGSGFSQDVVEKLVKQIGWSTKSDTASGKGYFLSYVGGAEQAGKGRPDPTMIRTAMQTLSLTNSSRVVKIGDTTVDIEEGQNAGCVTVAVLTGTQTRSELEKAKPHFVIESIKDLSAIWKEVEEKSKELMQKN